MHLFGKHVNIHIPSMLKKQLIDDCESITHLGKVIYEIMMIAGLMNLYCSFTQLDFNSSSTCIS